METSVMKRGQEAVAPAELSPDQVVADLRKVQEIMHSVMREGVDYGKVPGCGPKPVLLKPGAEKLCFALRLAAKLFGENEPRDLGSGHLQYVIRCEIYHIPTGALWGSGLGSSSTLETKYRRQSGSKDNPADFYNTVLKIAKKRALLDAVLTATAASDIFTQDVEDVGTAVQVPQVPQRKSEAEPLTTGDLISDKQSKRFYAIWKNVGVPDSEVMAKLEEYGYKHSREIRRADYNELCVWLEAYDLDPSEELEAGHDDWGEES